MEIRYSLKTFSVRCKVFFAILCILLLKNVYAQEEPVNFINIGSKEGLSSNIVNSILKDRYGYMWFATDDGLNKYDGSHFTVYRHDPDIAGSIISNDVSEIYEDGEGNLWIGTAIGLTFYNRRMDSFISYTSIVNYSVTSICSDMTGKIWVAGYDGLKIIDPKTGKEVVRGTELKNPEARRGMPGKGILRLFRDQRGRIWMGTSNGLYLYRRESGLFKRFVHLDSDPFSIADNTVRSVCEDNHGNIWFGTNNGLSMFSPSQNGFINYYHNDSSPATLNDNMIYAVASDNRGKLWVGTEQGLNIFDSKTKKNLRLEGNSRNRYGLIGKAVKNIFIDKQGIYWIAAFRAGVNKYDKNLPFFNFRQVNASDPSGLSASVVTSFAEGMGDDLYIGTDGRGLSLFNTSTGVSGRLTLPGVPASPALSIMVLERASSEVWIGTFLRGLLIMDLKTGQCRQITKGRGAQNISGNDIFSIRKDSRGNVWVGTNGQGVDLFDAKTKSFYHLNNTSTGKFRLMLNGYIRAIEEDRNGNMWIGSSGSGVAVYNPLNGRSRIFNRLNSRLPNDNVTAVCVARNGVVWVGLRGGLAFYNAGKDQFVCYTEKNGLANAVIYKILEDNAGKLWVSTNKGISSFDPASGKFKNYSYHNGLQRNPFVQGAGLKLPDGRMFFGGIDGFNYFDPEQLHATIRIPKVVLTDLKISNRSVVPGEDSEITEHISVAKDISLDYKQNFTLGFSALNYTSPEENRYLYKLDNFDKEWNQVGKSTTASYTNLSPGKYTFKVKARSDAGEWTTPETFITIHVRPPVWMTWYAFIFYVLLIASFLWYLRYRGIQRIKARFELEQERLYARQQIDQERHKADQLRQFDQLRIKFLTNVSHEFRTPVSLIVGPLDQLLQQETNPAKVRRLDMIRRNARRLLNLVNELLDFRNLEEKESKLNMTEGDFIAFARDVAESFRDLSERKQISFGFRSSFKYYFTNFDKDKIERILFNLLSNAFKFTMQGGEVVLSIQGTENRDGIKVILTDTGIGIENRKQEQIFEPFFQGEANPAILNQGSGIGLSIVKEFVKMHGGRVEVESIEGKGSVFSIYFPFVQVDGDGSAEDVSLSAEEPGGDPAGSPHPEAVSSSHLPVVLLVEDNEDFRFYLKDSLRGFYRIEEASNGKEGWQKVLSVHPQVVVSDISMPYVSGVELCCKIKSDKRTSHIPVMLLTALTNEDDQLQALETGADDYVTKPCNFEILNVKIRNLLALNERLRNTYSKQIKVAAPEVQIESDQEKFLNKVIQYIDSNLTNPQLSVEDLSRRMGMSRGSLYSKILEVTGETPVEFIRSIKLDRAAVLLEKSDMNVAQVSYSVGFSTPNYFSRAFRIRFNMLPSEYISLKREGTGKI